jgi:hypothetical protein
MPMWQQFVRVDLNRAMSGRDPRHPGNPERVCAYAVTTVRSPSPRRALLELAGSLNDTLRVWLNGRLLTPFPLTMGPAPRYRAVDLAAGDNGLLVQSCEDIGNWDFAVRLTDDAGRDLTDITTVAELPTDAMRQGAAPVEAGQLVEGFEGIVEGRLHEPRYPDHRGGSESWRSRVEDRSMVTWRTAPLPAAVPTVVAFTGSTSDEEGDFKLFVDGRYALTFRSHRDRELHSWSENGYTLVFVSVASAAGNAGFYLLSVPPDRITPGQPLILRVQGAGGDPMGWFMIKNFRDTIAYERLTPLMAIEAAQGPWLTRALTVSGSAK